MTLLTKLRRRSRQRLNPFLAILLLTWPKLSIEAGGINWAEGAGGIAVFAAIGVAAVMTALPAIAIMPGNKEPKIGANFAYEPTRAGSFFIHRYSFQYQFSDRDVLRAQYIVFPHFGNFSYYFGAGIGYFLDTNPVQRSGSSVSAHFEIRREKTTFTLSTYCEMSRVEYPFTIVVGIHYRPWPLHAD